MTIDEAIARAKERADKSGDCWKHCIAANNCKTCEKENEQIAEWLEELKANKVTSAEVTNKHFSKIMSFINTNNRGNSDYFIVDQIENYIAEQLKEQK